MLEIKFVRQNIEQVEKALTHRGEAADLETFRKADADRKSFLLEIEKLRHRRNVVSEQIADMKKEGKSADDLVVEMRQVSTRIKEIDKFLSIHEETINQIL